MLQVVTSKLLEIHSDCRDITVSLVYAFLDMKLYHWCTFNTTECFIDEMGIEMIPLKGAGIGISALSSQGLHTD